MSDTTAPAPAVEEAVEAAKVEATAPKPSFYTTPRLEFTKSKYLEMSVRAMSVARDRYMEEISLVRSFLEQPDRANGLLFYEFSKRWLSRFNWLLWPLIDLRKVASEVKCASQRSSFRKLECILLGFRLTG